MESFDWDERKRWAFGTLRLKPDEFWNLTMNELLEMIEGYVHEQSRQDDAENQRLSWLASHLMNSTGNYKKRIQPTDLYEPLAKQKEKQEKRKENGAVDKFKSKEEKEDYLKNLKEKFGR